MKQIKLDSSIVVSNKEKLLFAYSILNNKELYKPECIFPNPNSVEEPKDGHIFGADAALSYGNEAIIPSWDKFYEAHKEDEPLVFYCVAGCDSNDISRVTFTFVPYMANEETSEFDTDLIMGVDDLVGKKKAQSIIDSVVDFYEEYKDKYL